mmetsp:Transcript_94974/g.268876  ORF Transcript_94974/g.268876 Transcript_94974/m.268876 type:complete len:221 (-) Transcript_94974:201-863(-)
MSWMSVLLRTSSRQCFSLRKSSSRMWPRMWQSSAQLSDSYRASSRRRTAEATRCCFTLLRKSTGIVLTVIMACTFFDLTKTASKRDLARSTCPTTTRDRTMVAARTGGVCDGSTYRTSPARLLSAESTAQSQMASGTSFSPISAWSSPSFCLWTSAAPSCSSSLHSTTSCCSLIAASATSRTLLSDEESVESMTCFLKTWRAKWCSFHSCLCFCVETSSS